MTAAEPVKGEGSSEPEEGAGKLPGVAAHAAAWGFAFLILRIFAVSGYDWNTAFLVSTTLGLDDGLSLVFGSLLAGHLLTELLLLAVLPLLLAAYLWGPRTHRPMVLLLGMLALITLVALTTSFRSWWLPVAAAAVFAGLALVRRLPPGHRLRRVVASVMARVGLVTGMAVLLVAAFVRTPWVPHEVISMTDGPVSGYVLSVDSGYLNVLTDEGDFVILISGDVLSRE